ncbi:hypothetical protein B7494_g5234 [Chlorociboria aeruginascens]|nr:hypothetical protein B7494_g5234 [Chlorociboria aeruginascens]
MLCSIAKEQWDQLKEAFLPMGSQQLGSKLNAFNSYILPAQAKVGTIINDLRSLQQDLALISLEEKPTEAAMKSRLFSAVGAMDPRFEPTITLLDANNITNLQKGALQPSTGPEGSKKQGQGTKFKGECYNCGTKGHWSKDCRKPKKNKNSAKGSNKNPSTGPLATPNRGRGLSRGSTPEANQANSAEINWMAQVLGPKESLEDRNEAYLGANEPLWIVDSGCSRHITYQQDWFSSYRILDTPIEVGTALGAIIKGIAEGTVQLRIAVQGQLRTVALTNVLYIPGLAGSLLSVLQLQEKGFTIRTTPGATGKLYIELEGNIMGSASRLGKTYAIDGPGLSPSGPVEDPNDSEAEDTIIVDTGDRPPVRPVIRRDQSPDVPRGQSPDQDLGLSDSEPDEPRSPVIRGDQAPNKDLEVQGPQGSQDLEMPTG